jgi:hypothetical protein
LEYEELFENDRVIVSRVTIMPQDEIEVQPTVCPELVFVLQGGTITRFEKDGSMTDVIFPAGKTVFFPAGTVDEECRAVNNGTEVVEIIVTQLK